jgi:predicted RNA binding protein YcfA (HicA-like mRNA interferase family)
MPKVRDAIRLVAANGWFLARTRGSHRQYSHPVKPGSVTIAGGMSKDLAPGGVVLLRWTIRGQS